MESALDRKLDKPYLFSYTTYSQDWYALENDPPYAYQTDWLRFPENVRSMISYGAIFELLPNREYTDIAIKSVSRQNNEWKFKLKIVTPPTSGVARSPSFRLYLDPGIGSGTGGPYILNPQRPTAGGSITVDDALSTTSTNPVQNKVITGALNGKAPTSALDNYLPKSGGVLAGNLNVNGYRLAGLDTPQSSTDATNRAYVDDGLSNKLNADVFYDVAINFSNSGGSPIMTINRTYNEIVSAISGGKIVRTTFTTTSGNARTGVSIMAVYSPTNNAVQFVIPYGGGTITNFRFINLNSSNELTQYTRTLS